MGRPITHEFTQGKTILKFFDYKGAACIVKELGVDADANGHKIVKAGTPFPSDDSSCKGYIYVDVDVTRGDAPGTYRFEGDINNQALQENGVTVSDEAKRATPRVTFWD